MLFWCDCCKLDCLAMMLCNQPVLFASQQSTPCRFCHRGLQSGWYENQISNAGWHARNDAWFCLSQAFEHIQRNWLRCLEHCCLLLIFVLSTAVLAIALSVNNSTPSIGLAERLSLKLGCSQLFPSHDGPLFDRLSHALDDVAVSEPAWNLRWLLFVMHA